MKILFATSHFGFLRNFEFAIRELARRGHQFRLMADRSEKLGGLRTIENLVADYSSAITLVQGPKIKDTTWQPLGSALRLTQDYCHYLHPRYDRSLKLRARAAAQTPSVAVRLAQAPLMRSQPGLRFLRRSAHAVEQSLPVSQEVIQFLQAEDPDLLLVTPLLYFGSQQVEYVRAARLLGIRSVLCVGSWDHLTTKGLVHAVPDRILVWNETQRKEASKIHSIDPNQVTVTGAQAYDHWFTATPSVPRESFTRRIGLRTDQPILLYLCSSPFITPHEVGFVKRWIEGMRSSSFKELQEVGVLVRPHPQNVEQWTNVDLSYMGNAVVWPRGGANPVDAEARAEYFDSMYYSAAVVGVNTSGLIESAIAGRRVYTILDSEFASTQEGTLHFRHLQNVNGGFLHASSSFEDHYGQLMDLLSGHLQGDDRATRFVEAFIRPHGLNVAAADIFAKAVEAEAARDQIPVMSNPEPKIWHRVLYPLALAVQAETRRRRASARRVKNEEVFRDKDVHPEETQ